MPRKTDGIEFEIHPRPTKGEDGKPLLYVRPAKGRKKSFKQQKAVRRASSNWKISATSIATCVQESCRWCST